MPTISIKDMPISHGIIANPIGRLYNTVEKLEKENKSLKKRDKQFERLMWRSSLAR